MSVIGDLHFNRGEGKVIFKALSMLLVPLVLLYTIVGINGCKNVDKVSDSLIFRYNEDASVSTLDPAYIKSQSELWIAGQLYNGLVDLDSTLMPQPMLAKSWEILENGFVYKFHLRTDVQFHRQGKLGFKQARWVTAADVVYSFTRLLDPVTASPGAWIFSGNVDVNTLFSTQIPASEKPFYAPDDSTFVLRLRAPNSSMLSQLGTAYCYIVPKEVVEADKNAFARNPVGTGPFYLKLWEEDVKMVLRKNPDYFEYENKHRLPYLEAINVDFIKNKQTAFMRFVAGEYDFFNGLEGSFKDELLDRNGALKSKYSSRFQMLKMPFLNTEYLGFWLGEPKNQSQVLLNVHFRRALSMAVDRKALVQYLRNGIGDAGEQGFVPPVMTNQVVAGYRYDPAAAAEELAKAGFPGGKGCPELSITTTADYLDMAVYIQKFWQSLGLKIRIDVQTGGMLRQMRNKGDLPVFRGSWIADYADPENYLACFYSPNFSPGGPNYTHYKSAQFDRLYEQIVAETDADKRAGLVTSADSLLMADAAVLVLYYDKSLRLYQNHVKQLGNDASNRLILKRVYKVIPD